MQKILNNDQTRGALNFEIINKNQKLGPWTVVYSNNFKHTTWNLHNLLVYRLIDFRYQ